jgi:cation/acetate symporter
VNVVRKGRADDHEQFVVARLATVLLALLSILLGIAFKGQNVAFTVSLAFAIAASANYPVLILSMYWRKLTTRGAVVCRVPPRGRTASSAARDGTTRMPM